MNIQYDIFKLDNFKKKLTKTNPSFKGLNIMFFTCDTVIANEKMKIKIWKIRAQYF